MHRGTAHLSKLAITGASLLAALVLVEVVLRWQWPANRFYPYHPNLRKVTQGPANVAGVTGPTRFSTNELGCRGPSYAGQRFRLLVVGGSTAACVVLDDDEQWPQVVMDRVNAHFGDEGFLWVTNSGLAGRNSRHHLMHARYLVPRIPGLDHVLVYCGVNDVVRWLDDEHFDPRYLEDADNWRVTVEQSFLVQTFVPRDTPPLARLRTWQGILRALKGRGAGPPGALRTVVDGDPLNGTEAWLESWRGKRENERILVVPETKLATLDLALEAYETNLTRIVEEVRTNGAEPILMAQALQWPGLSPEERRGLLEGLADEGRAFVDPDQMEVLMGAFNGVMERVSRDLDVAFVDLPSALHGTGLYYDACHFTERGSAEAGRFVADFLVDRVYAAEGEAAPGGR